MLNVWLGRMGAKEALGWCMREYQSVPFGKAAVSASDDYFRRTYCSSVVLQIL